MRLLCAVLLLCTAANAAAADDPDEEISRGGAAPGYSNVRYIRDSGEVFTADLREDIVSNRSTLGEVVALLGDPVRREVINGSQWVVYETTRERGRAEWSDWSDEFKLYDMTVTGSRLRVRLDDDGVVVRWVYEEWSPGAYLSETDVHSVTRIAAERQEREETIRRWEEKIGQAGGLRGAVIVRAFADLEAAGITDPAVCRSMVNNALEAEGLEPLRADE